MRPIKLIIASIIFTVTLSAQTIDDQGCTGAVGDVKYSILSEADFISFNGDCWIAFDGNMPSHSRLSDLTYRPASDFPNAGGYFIRSFDTNISNRVDVDRSPSEAVASIQQDEIKSHHHDFSHPLLRLYGDSNSDTNGADGDGSSLTKTENEGGSETRPKNITLYTYIRIN